MRKLAWSVLTLLAVAPNLRADISILRDQLLSADQTTVANAAKAAESLTPKERKLLVMSLVVPLHRNPASAQAAAHALAFLGKEAEEALPELIAALRYDDPAVALAVGGALLKIGTPAVSPLIKALDDGNFVVRQRAASILGAFGPEARRAAPALVELLEDSQTATIAESVLLKIGEPAVPALSDAARKSPAASRQSVVRILGQFGPSAVPVLIQTLRKDDTASIRATAAEALSTLRPVAAAVVPALIDALKDPDDNVRTAVVNALIRLGPDAKAALGVLIRASHRDSEALVRQSSVRAIEKIGKATPHSIPGLVENLKAAEGAIRRESVLALTQGEISPAELTPLLAIAVKDPDPVVKLPAVQAAAELVKSYSGAVPLLRIASFDNDKKVKPVAIEALGGAAAAPDAAALVLEDVIKDADPGVRNQCIQALARLGPAAVPALLRETHDSYTILGTYAEQAIVAMGPAALPALEKEKTTPDAVLQQKIPQIMAQIEKAGQPASTSPKKKTTPRH